MIVPTATGAQNCASEGSVSDAAITALIDRWPLRSDHPIAFTVFAEAILKYSQTGTSQAFHQLFVAKCVVDNRV